jgi:hypothetical protein
MERKRQAEKVDKSCKGGRGRRGEQDVGRRDRQRRLTKAAKGGGGEDKSKR